MPHRETFWEQTANSRWGSYISGVEEKQIRLAHELYEKPGRALEIGADGGRWSHLLSKLGWSMTCTDINVESLEVCQSRLPDSNCILVDVASKEIPCTSNSIDLILCIEVDDVLESDWFIPEVNRVLDAQGVMVAVFQNSHSIRGAFKNSFPENPDSWQHYKMSYAKSKQRLEELRFQAVYEEGICWFPFRRSSDSLLIPLVTKVEQFTGLRRLPKWSPWVVATFMK